MSILKQPKRIDQLLPHLAPRDAIGIEVLHIRDLLRARGFISEIFAEDWSPELDGEVFDIYDHEKVANSDDAISVYHYSVGSKIPFYLSRARSFRVTRYHNITPAQYFAVDDGLVTYFEACRLGRMARPIVKIGTDDVWAVSKYNGEELEPFGFPKATVLPLVREYETLVEQSEVGYLSNLLKDGKKNILFVGRVVPNKTPHDLLFYLKLYQKYVDKNVRLAVVGRVNFPGYPEKFEKLARELDLKIATGSKSLHDGQDADVLLPGGVSDAELATFYRHADLFLCLSEHEGFCVPLIEAMLLKVPIIAHRAAAVPETMGEAGILVDKTHPVQTLSAIRRVLNDSELAGSLCEKGLKRSQLFTWSELKKSFYHTLDETLENYKKRGS